MLNKAQTAILKALLVAPLLTEHELVKAVANTTRTKDTDVMPTIGKTLMGLKDEGFLWVGQLFTKGGCFMWAACITQGGREHMRNAARARASEPQGSTQS